MNIRTIDKLDESNSAFFTACGDPKLAVLRWEPRRYELSWGTQAFDGPHMVVMEQDHEYGVDLEVFFATHRPVADSKDHYRKHVKVRAVQAKEDTRIITEIDGHVEMEATVPAGAWIIQNPAGELYYNTPDEFEARYEPVEDS